jgi:hypothetical protein
MEDNEDVLPGDIDIDIYYNVVYVFIRPVGWNEEKRYVSDIEQIEIDAESARVVRAFADLGTLTRIRYNK